MKAVQRIIAAILIVTLTACASYRPIVDTKGVDMNQYNIDLQECQTLAGQVDPGQRAAGGALIGAIFGALLGAAVNGRQGSNYGAGVGAVDGAAAGVASGAQSQVRIVKNCMQHRGYAVLD